MAREKARLLDQPDDYKRLGVNPKQVEVWEDRRRNTNTGAGNWEWWYFDAILDDGSTAVIQFFTKSGTNVKKKGDYPTWKIKISAPDGKHYETRRNYKPHNAYFGQERCEVQYGKSHFKGDLKNYSICTEETNGIAAELSLGSLAQPYRPGTAYFTFNTDDEYYTWLCVVPKGKVTGTLTYGGKTVNVTGYGYHDHQWGNVPYIKEWNHWVWARQSFEDYSMLVFDMVSAEKTNFSRFPIVFIQDKNGNLVFENTENVVCKVLADYHDKDVSGKYYPKSLHYIFENDAKRVEYSLSFKKIIEARGSKNFPLPFRLMMKAMRLNASYARYLADGELKLTNHGEVIERKSELIYEFMYPGPTYKGHI